MGEFVNFYRPNLLPREGRDGVGEGEGTGGRDGGNKAWLVRSELYDAWIFR